MHTASLRNTHYLVTWQNFIDTDSFHDYCPVSVAFVGKFCPTPESASFFTAVQSFLLLIITPEIKCDTLSLWSKAYLRQLDYSTVINFIPLTNGEVAHYYLMIYWKSASASLLLAVDNQTISLVICLIFYIWGIHTNNTNPKRIDLQAGNNMPNQHTTEKLVPNSEGGSYAHEQSAWKNYSSSHCRWISRHSVV